MNQFLENLEGILSKEQLHRLLNLPTELAVGEQIDHLYQLLTSFHFIEAKIGALGSQSLIDDYEKFFSLKLPISAERMNTLRLIQGAIRISAHILDQDKTQVRSQIYGRLVVYGAPEIQAMLAQMSQLSVTPWLRLLTPGLILPDGPLL